MTIRNEKGKFEVYAWPGGYPIFYLMDDCETLCPNCANNPSNPIHEDEPNDGWRIIAADINYEDQEMYCCHCNTKIDTAYPAD
jgi:hypothetical protein